MTNSEALLLSETLKHSFEVVEYRVNMLGEERTSYYKLTKKKLMKYVKGPDFPTGGIVINKDDLLSIYETGAGKIRLRGKVTTEKGKNGHIQTTVGTPFF